MTVAVPQLIVISRQEDDVLVTITATVMYNLCGSLARKPPVNKIQVSEF